MMPQPPPNMNVRRGSILPQQTPPSPPSAPEPSGFSGVLPQLIQSGMSGSGGASPQDLQRSQDLLNSLYTGRGRTGSPPPQPAGAMGDPVMRDELMRRKRYVDNNNLGNASMTDDNLGVPAWLSAAGNYRGPEF